MLLRVPLLLDCLGPRLNVRSCWLPSRLRCLGLCQRHDAATDLVGLPCHRPPDFVGDGLIVARLHGAAQLGRHGPSDVPRAFALSTVERISLAMAAHAICSRFANHVSNVASRHSSRLLRPRACIGNGKLVPGALLILSSASERMITSRLYPVRRTTSASDSTRNGSIIAPSRLSSPIRHLGGATSPPQNHRWPGSCSQ